MQPDAFGITIAHSGNYLSGLDHVIFSDLNCVVVGVGAQVLVVVLEQDKVAIASHPATGVDHDSRAGCLDRLPLLSGNINAGGDVTALPETTDQLAIRGPLPRHLVDRRIRLCRTLGLSRHLGTGIHLGLRLRRWLGLWLWLGCGVRLWLCCRRFLRLG